VKDPNADMYDERRLKVIFLIYFRTTTKDAAKPETP